MIIWFLFWFQAMKVSLIAFVVALVFGLFSMGFLGIGLYYVNYPIFRLWFPPADQWHGDWVWPATIGIGMGWSFAFLVAGVVNHYLLNFQVPPLVRAGTYALILWLWAFVIWFVVLKFQPSKSF